MMKFLYRFMLCTLLLITSATVYASNSCRQNIDNCMQFFYQSPSTDKLIQIAEAPTPYGSPQPLQIFIALVLYKNSNIAKNIVSQFPHFSPKTQKLFLNALSSMKNGAAQELAKKYNLSPEKTLSLSGIKNIKINDNATMLDTLWDAYFATGDIIYPEKILEFISNHDDYIFKTAFYVENGMKVCPPDSIKNNNCPWLPLEKIRRDLESRYSNESKTIFHQMLVLSSALESMNSLRQQDPLLNKKIFSICREKPKLDYLVKIFPNNKDGYWGTTPLQGQSN